ncbi:hypothetical protein [Bacillus sp. JCM 19034]|uniref:hypothetical protein n=1 Tax=Bacillus sp. JCM 19034 TaxID=1481928 RepID=UPI00078468AD|nr:hypothetical protein [Bacillus sp. JCM 19034]
MVVIMEYVLPNLSTGELNVKWISILIWMLGGVFFGTAMYWFFLLAAAAILFWVKQYLLIR